MLRRYGDNMKYIVLFEGQGACDYSIKCGQMFDVFDAECLKEAQDYVLSILKDYGYNFDEEDNDYGLSEDNDYGLDIVEIYEISENNKWCFDIEKMLEENKKIIKKELKKEKELKDIEELKRLKEIYE